MFKTSKVIYSQRTRLWGSCSTAQEEMSAAREAGAELCDMKIAPAE